MARLSLLRRPPPGQARRLREASEDMKTAASAGRKGFGAGSGFTSPVPGNSLTSAEASCSGAADLVASEEVAVSGNSDLPIRSLTPAERGASDALQVSYQRDSIALLAELLADAQGLGPLNWTVAHAGARLTGWCMARPESRRLDEFSAWRAFLLTRGGKPDLEQNPTLNGGEMRLAAEWRYYSGSTVTVTLAASIPRT
jgi:hypothetical protein